MFAEIHIKHLRKIARYERQPLQALAINYIDNNCEVALVHEIPKFTAGIHMYSIILYSL
jgi:hypothetical protein